MADTKRKGDLGELRVAFDLMDQGHRVAFPFGEDWDFDLVLYRGNKLERVQVKYVRSDGAVIKVECRSRSLTKGRVRSTKHYDESSIDWLAVYDATTDMCFYIPADRLGAGRCMVSLRVEPPRNNQRIGINRASDYASIEGRRNVT